MSYQIIDQGTGGEWSDIFHESHIEERCLFTYGDDSTPVNVQNPKFTVKNSKGVEVSTIYILRPLQKMDDEEIGRYRVTFLSNNMAVGTYTIEFTGTYNGDTITITGTLRLREVKREQYCIDWLRTLLGDKRNIQMPRKYLTWDYQNHQWEDGELYYFLQTALQDMNNAIPITENEFTLGNVPSLTFPLLGGQIYALSAIMNVESANFFDFSAGTIRVNLYKGDKYMGLARFIKEEYYKPLAQWKKWYGIYNIKYKVIAQRRVPMRVLRPLSMVAHYHSLAPAATGRTY